MSAIDLGNRRHDDEYPKPVWLQEWLGRRALSTKRTLSSKGWPLHNYRSEMVKAIDGDTMEVDVILREGEKSGLGRVIVTERVRLLGYNSPELNQPGGQDAKVELDRLIPAGATVYVHTYYDRRSFNRILAWAYVDGGGATLLDVAETMVKGGFGTRA